MNGDSAWGAGTWLAAGFPRELVSRAEGSAVKKARLGTGLLGSCILPSRRSNVERRVGAPLRAEPWVLPGPERKREAVDRHGGPGSSAMGS